MADSNKSAKKRAESAKKDEPDQRPAEQQQGPEQDDSARSAAPLTPDGEDQQERARRERDAADQDQEPTREEAAGEAVPQGEGPDQSEPIHHRANRPATSAAPLDAPEQQKKGEEAFVPPQVTNVASGMAADSGERSRVVVAGTGDAPDPDDLFTDVGGDGMVGVKHRLLEHTFAQPYDRRITRLLLHEGQRVIPFHADRLKESIRQQVEADKQEASGGSEQDQEAS